MQDSVDQGLARLATMQVPASLDDIETIVFATIDENARDRAAGRMIGAWSVAMALALGLVGGTGFGIGVTPAQAASPIGIDGALAPSTLLLGR